MINTTFSLWPRGVLLPILLVVVLAGCDTLFGEDPDDDPDPDDDDTLTVTFDANGGTFGDDQETQTVEVDHGETVEEPEEPERDGYDFDGWFLEEEGTDQWDFDEDTVEEDLTLYAGWSEKATGMPDVLETIGVSTYDELADALETAEQDYDPDELEDPEDKAVLIELEDDISESGFEEHGKLEYAGEVSIYLRGNVHDPVTINAGGHSQVLEIAEPEGYSVFDPFEPRHRIYMEGLRVTGGNDEGPAIHSTGPLLEPNFVVMDSEFEENAGWTALNLGESVVLRSSFRNNESGALRLSWGEIKDSEFHDNGSGVGGFELEIIGSEFKGHSRAVALSYGGRIEDSTFEDNVVPNPSGVHTLGGGAIRVGTDDLAPNDRLPLEIVDSEFINNGTETSEGGAIYANGNPDEDLDGNLYISVENTTFEGNFIDNTFPDEGGAIYTASPDEEIRTADSTYIDNDEAVLYSDTGALINEGSNTFEQKEEPYWPVTDVIIEQDDFTLEVGESKQLEAHVEPENVTDDEVSWSSTDEEVATVTADGEVEAQKEGTAWIIADSPDSDVASHGSVEVTVVTD